MTAYEEVRRVNRVRRNRISTAGVQASGIGVVTAPYYHFTAGPDCRVIDPRSGGIRVAGGNPTVGDRFVTPAND